MATHSFRPGSPATPGASAGARSGSPVWNSSYSVAAARASLIAMALLVVLAAIVLF